MENMTMNDTSPDFTAYLLDELPPEERAGMELALESDPTLREELECIRRTHEELSDHLAVETGPEPLESGKSLPFITPTKATPFRRTLLFLGTPSGFAALAACVTLTLATLQFIPDKSVERTMRAEVVESRATSPEPKNFAAPKPNFEKLPRLAQESAAPPSLTDATRAAPSATTGEKISFASGLSAGGMSKGTGGGYGGGEGAGVGIGKGGGRNFVSTYGAAARAGAYVDHQDFPRSHTGIRNPAGTGDRFDSGVTEQPFVKAAESPLSTFSIDVNTASYAYARRVITSGVLPPPASVRIEEWLNNFGYAYPEPKAPHPVSVYAEASECPWNMEHRLVRVGLRARSVTQENRPPCNIVFLVDTSGSMSPADRLPLAKEALIKLLGRLDARDRVGIVTYAGTSGIAATPTVCDEVGKKKLESVILALGSGGSTNGAAGLRDAYELASRHLNIEGVNRVVLATDGDFNVGLSGTAEIVDLAKREAGKKVFLTVIGFGTGNLNADLMKQLSVKADGNHYYIDSLKEADRVLSQKLAGTLVTVARDVKIQIDFNPAKVASYRLIGYDTRRLANEDFNDDAKDAGEMGAGHTVTALYEIVPVGSTPPVDESRYVGKRRAVEPAPAGLSDDWLTVKVRYQSPGGGKSTLIERPLRAGDMSPLDKASSDQIFAAAVAEVGLALRHSAHKGSADLEGALKLLDRPGVLGDDQERKEFRDLISFARHASNER